ncbi:MAG: Fe-S cluster assembly ATPase SufC [Vicinamibacterales bacterium]|nr:Fe-S cluster assembly ATPase SufC [Vicinamibacterales bacterium]
MALIEISSLHVSVEGNEILKGLDLTVDRGQVHCIMGPNGSGKSTLARVLAGHESYEVTNGRVTCDGRDLLELSADERARAGLFMAFQYPVEIPGVNNTEFLKAALNAVRAERGEEALDAMSILKLLREKMQLVRMPEDLLKRSVNEGFSGGEMKKHEVFQMAVLEPKLCVMDETDSGLDIDALRIVADGVNAMRHAERGFLVITHYQRLLEYIVPDIVHVLMDGRIVRSGGKELALELEEKGYAWVSGKGSSACPSVAGAT